MTLIEEIPERTKLNKEEYNAEVDRLYSQLSKLGWSREACESIAPITLQINHLKKEKGIKILAHSYQTADIIVGVADIVGDSLGLAKKATEISLCR